MKAGLLSQRPLHIADRFEYRIPNKDLCFEHRTSNKE